MRNTKKLIAFNYFGGKFGHTDWIIKRLPPTKSYIEVFGGSGIILINRKPSKIESFNDINSLVVNFFKTLRDQSEELITKIYMTPYSRQEYLECYNNINEGDNIERARRFFVVVGQSFNGTYSRQTGWKMSTIESRSNISEAVSRWNSKIPNLITIIERIKQVQILNYDFRIIFEKFDHPDALFYCDPPYVHETRCNNNEYQFEMNQQDHIDLLEIYKNIKGKVAISGYENDLYNDHLRNFYKSTAKEKRTTLFHSVRREILWTNYDPYHINKNLFNQEDRIAS